MENVPEIKFKVKVYDYPKDQKPPRVKKEVTDNTLGLSFGSIWIFKEDYIKLFDGRLLNTHGARLPQDRGGGGFSWRILRNERLGYSLIHQVDAGIDTGNIVAVDEYVYPHSCRITLDYEKYSKCSKCAKCPPLCVLAKSFSSLDAPAHCNVDNQI